MRRESPVNNVYRILILKRFGAALAPGFDVIDDAAADTLRRGSALDWLIADLDGLDGDLITAEMIENL